MSLNIEKIITKLKTNNSIVLLEEYSGAHKKHLMKCIICEHEWSATITSKLQGFDIRKTKGCPNCNTKNKQIKNTTLFFQQLQHRNETITPIVLLYPKDQIYINNYTKLQFKCVNDHIWKARPGNILVGTGCPICKLANDSINKRKNSSNIIKTIAKLYPNQFDLNTIQYHNVHTPMTIDCNIHGNITVIPTLFLNENQGCQKCNLAQSQSERHASFVTQARLKHNNNYTYDNVIYINSYSDVIITCPIHGDFNQYPATHIKGHGCPKCVTRSFSKKQISWLTHIEKKQNISIQHALNGGEFQIPGTRFFVDGYCVDNNTVYEFHGDAFHGNLNRYSKNKLCHPYNNNKTAEELYNQTKEREQSILDKGFQLVTIWESDFDNLNIPSITIDKKKSSGFQKQRIIDTTLCNTLQISFLDDIFFGYKHKHSFKCNICNDSFLSTLTQRKQAFKKYNSVGCPNCNKKGHTLLNSVYYALNENTKILKNSKIIQLTDTIAISTSEFKNDAEQQHSRKHYILELTEEYNTRGIQLITIFEDEWVSKKLLILNKINHIIKKTNYAKTIYARKCTITQITKKVKNEFLNKYHIQGTDNSQILLGALYDNELVAVMTFSPPRVSVGNININEKFIFELTRFATNINYSIPGIAGKLLTHFEKHYDWKQIYSFADRRWSVGNMYHKIGFELERLNLPSYFYIIDNKRKHRWNYRKDILKNTLSTYDSKLTEYQNMLNIGIDRIWDCGTLRFIKYNKHVE